MKTGLLLPTWSGSMNGATPTTRDIIAFAELAEQVGFDSLWVSDHFLNEPYVDYADASRARCAYHAGHARHAGVEHRLSQSGVTRTHDRYHR